MQGWDGSQRVALFAFLSKVSVQEKKNTNHKINKEGITVLTADIKSVFYFIIMTHQYLTI